MSTHQIVLAAGRAGLISARGGVFQLDSFSHRDIKLMLNWCAAFRFFEFLLVLRIYNVIINKYWV